MMFNQRKSSKIYCAFISRWGSCLIPMCALFLASFVNGASPISQNSVLKVNQERIVLHDLASEYVNRFFVWKHAHIGITKKSVPFFTEEKGSFLDYSLSKKIYDSCNKGAFNTSVSATEIRSFVKKLDRDLMVFHGGVKVNNV
jgi:hypothetical protein